MIMPTEVLDKMSDNVIMTGSSVTVAGAGLASRISESILIFVLVAVGIIVRFTLERCVKRHERREAKIHAKQEQVRARMFPRKVRPSSP